MSAELTWLQPFPDALLPPSAASPEAHFLARESITLGFIALLQLLPARQRAVLILRDALDWSAREVAALLESTVPSVESALHRARATLSRHQLPSEVRPRHSTAACATCSNATSRRGSARTSRP